MSYSQVPFKYCFRKFKINKYKKIGYPQINC